MGKYAADTTVSPEKSLAEIRGVVARYGGADFTFGERADKVVVGFRHKGRLVRIEAPLPPLEEFTHIKRGPHAWNWRRRSEAQMRTAREAEVRRRWRVLLLWLKAKLEAADDESGLTDFGREFLSWTVLPGGGTVGEQLLPRIDRAIAEGDVPGDLLALPAGRD